MNHASVIALIARRGRQKIKDLKAEWERIFLDYKVMQKQKIFTNDDRH